MVAELILGAVGLGLATPGAVAIFCQYGDFIQKKVDSFKNAPAIVGQIGSFGRDLHQGKLKIDMELVEWGYGLPDLDPMMRASLEDHINGLRALIQDADYSLGKLFDKDGNLRRTYFAVIGERRAQRLVTSLKEWQSDFTNIIALIEMKRRVWPEILHLPWEKYRPKRYKPLYGSSNLHFGSAEIMDSQAARSVSVLVELKPCPDTNARSEIREVASILARHLCRANASSGGGILPCLGFRDGDEHAELVFEIPAGLGNPRILRDVIAADAGSGSHPLEDRLRLARQLCNAVFSVFTSGLVHKSIRTDTILLLAQDTGSSPTGPVHTAGLGVPHLTSWSMLRKTTGLTSGPGEGDHTKDFYRHPKRQGLQPEQRYNMGHDLYSLGVCLLEISLWQPFFAADGVPSQVFRDTAVKLKFVDEEDATCLPKLAAPWLVAEVLRSLAESEIPPRMGTRFSKLVVACLTCLEGGMGDQDSLKNNRSEAAVRFNELVAQSLTISGI